MSCCKRRTKRAEKRLRKNHILPVTNYDYKNSKVNKESIDHIIKDVLICEGCKQEFNLGSNELKIHCNGCDQRLL